MYLHLHKTYALLYWPIIAMAITNLRATNTGKFGANAVPMPTAIWINVARVNVRMRPSLKCKTFINVMSQNSAYCMQLISLVFKKSILLALFSYFK